MSNQGTQERLGGGGKDHNNFRRIKVRKKLLGIAIAALITLSLIAIPFSGCAGPAPTTTPTTPTTPTATTPTPTTPTTPAGPTYDWKISQPYPEGVFMYDLAEDFISKVADASDGRIIITHYPGSLLGNPGEVQESLTAGSQEMAWTWPRTSINPKWDVAMIHYETYNWERSLGMFGPNGWKIPIVDSIAGECNWKFLGTVLSGENNVISNELFDPLDPSGRKIRVQASKSFSVLFDALGYSPVTMPMSEVASALATGVIDASGGCAQQEFKVYGDAFKYLYAYHDRFTVTWFFMNLDVWNSLSAGDQQIIEKASAESIAAIEERFGELVASDYNGLLPWQIVVTLDGNAWSTCAEKARATQWAWADEVVGKDNMDIVRANADPLPWGLTLDEMDYGYGVLTEDWIIKRQGEIITGR